MRRNVGRVEPGELHRNAGKKEKTMGDTFHRFLCSMHVYLAYTLVGTGEHYSAFAALSFLVIWDTFLLAACLEMVCLAAACFSFFSAIELRNSKCIVNELNNCTLDF